MKTQIREAIGWLVYECEQYVTLTWDRDAEPPTLEGGDPIGWHYGFEELQMPDKSLARLFEKVLSSKENSK
jgi:hypothetical protein